ncbi:TRAP transporter small permease subunit [Spiribacter curvatus]|uniref:TRAP transporter small permease subunit n=1 Tax=Spiribacter curvatus TaxID=1335757 RepID=UPI00059BAAD0|nr:TRAP transporter small permease subunit [Spiribacter curvatus]
MRVLLRLSRAIDALNDRVGIVLRGVALLLIALGVINVVGRYLGARLGMQLSSNALLEGQIQAFAIIFLLGSAYLLRHDGHIRVDILQTRFSRRLRAWVDLLGTLLALVPFCGVMIAYGIDYVALAWSRLEVSPNPGGLPLYPIKTVLLIGFTLLLLQGVSQAIKAAATLREHGS